MGEQTIAVLSSDQLLACTLSLDLINSKTLELAMLKRGHQHLWNELARKYGVDKKTKIQIDYKTGVITAEASEPDKVSKEMAATELPPEWNEGEKHG